MTTASNKTTKIKTGPIALIASIVLTLIIYYTPQLGYVSYPLMLLSTLAHELGHGITAMLMGGTFESFQMHDDGSGVAMWSGSVGPFARAAIAAGGLVGPAVVAGILFASARRPKSAKIMLWIFAAALGLALVLVVRNLFGIGFVTLIAIITALVATKGSEVLCQWYCSFIGAQLGLSVFSRGDYLFTNVAETAQGPMPSDVAQMAEALWLPYWIWGGFCGVISVVILIFGLVVAFRE